MKGILKKIGQGVSKRDVYAAYQTILGRPPENEAAVAFHLKHKDVWQLVGTLIRSYEFQQIFARGAVRSLDRGWQRLAPPLAIECDPTDEETLSRLFDHVRQTWKEWGRIDPHFSVLTHQRFTAEEFYENESEFYAAGAADAEIILCALARAKIKAERLPVCLEYGCGVGRVSWKLASIFERVLALDLSEEHLHVARRWLDKCGVRNVELQHLGNWPAYHFGDYDFWFSRLVLQQSAAFDTRNFSEIAS